MSSEPNYTASSHAQEFFDKKRQRSVTHQESILEPFFGSNVPGPKREVVAGEHPCADLSRSVHTCLDVRNNKVDFCIPVVSRLEMCLREQGL